MPAVIGEDGEAAISVVAAGGATVGSAAVGDTGTGVDVAENSSAKSQPAAAASKRRTKSSRSREIQSDTVTPIEPCGATRLRGDHPQALAEIIATVAFALLTNNPETSTPDKALFSGYALYGLILLCKAASPRPTGYFSCSLSSCSLSLRGVVGVAASLFVSEHCFIPRFHPHPNPLPQGRGRIK